MIWVPTFLMRQCGGLWCHCYLSFHLDDPLASGLCSSKQQRAYGPSRSYPHPNGRRRILDFCLHWGHAWDTRNKVPDSWDSVSSMSVVICGYSYDFINFRAPAAAGFDGIIDPTTTVRICAWFPFQKVKPALPWCFHQSLWFNYHWCKQFRLVYSMQHP